MKYVGSRWFFADFPSILDRFPTETEVTDPETLRHLLTVLRAMPGETVTLVDAERERAYHGVLLGIERRAARVRLDEYEVDSSGLGMHCTLAVSLIKEQRWDWFLQKATELGARTIQPVLAKRSVVRLPETDHARKCARWRQVARSAAEQCESRFIPSIAPPMTVQEYTGTLLSSDALKCLLKERGSDRLPLRQGLDGVDAGRSVIFAVGPEGGWADEEVRAFEQAGFGPYSLGARVLRSETAAIAALSSLVFSMDGVH